jgi:hypothetical protein
MKRRIFFLGTTALVAVGCAVTTNGTVTAVTLNVAKVDAYAKVISSGGAMLLGLSFIAGPMGPGVVLIVQAALTGVAAAIAAIDKESNGAISVSYDNANVRAAISSMLTNAQVVLSNAQAAAATQTGADVTTAQTYIKALNTAILLVQAMLGGFGAPKLPMTEAEMFKSVGVKAP